MAENSGAETRISRFSTARDGERSRGKKKSVNILEERSAFFSCSVDIMQIGVGSSVLRIRGETDCHALSTLARILTEFLGSDTNFNGANRLLCNIYAILNS